MNYIFDFFCRNLPILGIIFLICIILGYIFGSIPCAYLYCKSHGVNILEFGSGNPGSTNVSRALGKNHGRNVFFLDIFKVILPIFLLRLLYQINIQNLSILNQSSSCNKFYNDFITIYTGLGAIIGHNFPVFLQFKGGKGISCTMGTIFCLSIPYSLFLFLIYKIASKLTKYVSFGSLLALTSLLLFSIVFSFNNIYPFNYSDNNLYGLILLPGIIIIWGLGVIRHKSNIIRLINGTENKTI